MSTAIPNCPQDDDLPPRTRAYTPGQAAEKLANATASARSLEETLGLLGGSMGRATNAIRELERVLT